MPDHIWRAKGGGKGKGGGGGGKGTWQPHFNKFGGGGKGKGKGKGKSMMKNFPNEQKVWVGGLTEAVTWKALQELADTVGKSKWCEVLAKGQACVCYGTVEEAQTAIATLNGSSAGDIVLQFDVWTKKEKE